MANRSVLGLFTDAESAAKGVDAVREAGFTDADFDMLTGSPYPAGAFGEREPGHKAFIFPLVGAVSGFSVGLLITAATQLSYPLVTGGKPILSLPPMAIIMYEGTMLGAIIFTVLGVIFESRLPRLGLGAYDARITEGYIGLQLVCAEERLATAEQTLRRAGAVDIVSDRGRG